MKILIEDYHYSPQDLPPLDGLTRTELSGGMVKFSNVGYYYDGEAREAIFILPKVFLKDSKAFGKYTPERERVSYKQKIAMPFSLRYRCKSIRP